MVKISCRDSLCKRRKISIKSNWIVPHLGAHQAMNDSRELKRRLMKYLIPVVALSIAMNVTKFLEIELVFTETVVDIVDGYNITEWR